MSDARPSVARTAAFAVLAAAALLLPFFGPAGILVSAVLVCAILGVPLFVIIGVLTILCFLVIVGETSFAQYTILIESARGLADSEPLLAVPLFIMSGAVMSRGQISDRLIQFSNSAVGWMPGGLAVSAVLACMLFAAISGSSPATVVAIGGMMGPSLIAQGYQERFSHGLLTTAGSLGILIPPSIPMIVYPIVNLNAVIPVETLFASGIGPGLVLGSILMGFSVYHGLTGGAARQAFRLGEMRRASVDGFWSLMFPVLILGGIWGGIFYAVEAAAISVVYAVAVEVYVHRALKLRDMPTIFAETGVFLGALLVIMVVALAFNGFLADRQIPEQAVAWLQSMELDKLQFLLIVNVMLLGVGMLMDILSAMLIFVPLMAPLAMSMGVDPLHFGIIFIVNLEIGYLTPPVGLNLFVASTLYDKPLTHMVRAVLPFIALMLVGLGVITYFEPISVGLGRYLMDDPAAPEVAEDAPLGDEPVPLDEVEEAPEPDGEVQTLEEMMRELEGGGGGADGEQGAAEPPEEPGRVLTLDEMMDLAEEEAEAMEAEEALDPALAPDPEPPLGEPAP
ncbi:MAG: TRAP transporter large permease [Sandaracinaceae bacterium]